jgi:GNAT superfamily N-acetyltransferase
VTPATDRWPLEPVGTSIERASAAQLADVVDILEDAFVWVTTLGQRSYPAGSFTAPASRPRAQVLEALEAGELYLARVRGDPAGTVSLFEEDEAYWPGASRDALYVHKLAVRRRYAGLRLGGAILRWADERARERGKAFLRLDTAAGNEPLLAYYGRAGFRRMGEVRVRDFVVATFERPVG